MIGIGKEIQEPVFFMNMEGLLCDREYGEKPLYSCTRSREWFLVSLMNSFYKNYGKVLAEKVKGKE